MATIVLSAVGGAFGASIGGAAFGLSSVVIGKAIGATIGRSIDNILLGSGSDPVEHGRVDSLRLLGSQEGVKIPRLYGSMRVGGQIIWATEFKEHVNSTGGGKGTAPSAEIREYSYTISFAIALCEGEITRIGKVWADGKRISLEGLDYRLYRGTEDQLPDTLISAVEGAEDAPAYRGVAYIVFENFDVTRFGNRIPQLNFEVLRRIGRNTDTGVSEAADLVKAVALIPGTGEYALATESVKQSYGKGVSSKVNVHSDSGETDLVRSITQLSEDIPNCEATSLVVSWFGDDLRCGSCNLQPAVEQTGTDAGGMPWTVSGVGRGSAKVVSDVDGRPLFGGTPTDQSVIQAIQHLQAQGKSVMFYPFILMDIQEDNGLPDPWSDAADQPRVPWRGRITTSKAPGQAGSPDQTAAAAAEVTSFFGTASVSDFSISGTAVNYTGPAEWSYRRFILHYAYLCAAAGGVDAFCIGSEMRSLTQIRDDADSFPAVSEFVQLLADVRAILGPDAKIGYAADWSEYFGYHPGGGDVYFHLDPLWSDPNLDFIGIDNYMPLSDWRDDPDHADNDYQSIYDLDYLRGNIEGGEGFDWYYPHEDARKIQDRNPITDGAYEEPWVYRYKDIRSWWSNQHFNRVGGVRDTVPTEWLPGLKPVWFTEIGCPAVDKGTNQPNLFVDPKSDESAVPYYSNGNRDDMIQHRYIEALISYWNDPANNPEASRYVGRMIEIDRAFVWAWDIRPFPDFPEQLDSWSDGVQFAQGHWISGRINIPSVGSVVDDICQRAGMNEINTARLHGLVRGYLIQDTESARQSLQPLMLAVAFDGFERDGELVFLNRNGKITAELQPSEFVLEKDNPVLSLTRRPNAETVGRLRIGFVDIENDHQSGAAEHLFPDEVEANISESQLPLALRETEGQAIAQRWLSEARIARDEAVFTLPPSQQHIGQGDVVALPHDGDKSLYRVDRLEDGMSRKLYGTRIEPGVYAPRYRDGATRYHPGPVQFGEVYAEFLDLPLLTGAETEHAFHIGATSDPWPGRVSVFKSADDFGYEPALELRQRAIVGELLVPLVTGTPGIWQRVNVRVSLSSGSLQSRSETEVLNGANLMAVRYGGAGEWELIQFQDAVLVGDGEYRLSGLLRGQAGTEFVIPSEWPIGTNIVLINSAVQQVNLLSSERGLERHYRVGASHLPYDSDAYLHVTYTGNGVGLRPYSPVHLRAENVGGDVILGWTRRTRIDGDVWQSFDVPLGETVEKYTLQILVGVNIVREVELSQPDFTYTAAMQSADGALSGFSFRVAQISDRYGAGPFEGRNVNV